MKRKKIIKKLRQLGFDFRPLTGTLLFKNAGVTKMVNMTDLTIKDIEANLKEQNK